MPELPEVETLRRELERTLLGRAVAGFELGLPKLFLGPRPPNELLGRRVEALRRRAKFLILKLSDGLTLLAHLRLSGQLVHRSPAGQTLAAGGHPVPLFDAPLPHKATHAVFRFDDDSCLYLTDIRQFGRLWLMPYSDVDEFLRRTRLGPEPLADDFSELELRQRLAKRPRSALKPLLLDQTFVGGVGNIYADEIAFEASLSPLTLAGKLSPGRAADLHQSIRSVLQHAVTHGVAEILNGRANPEHDFPRVHGRAGQPCPRCGSRIVKSRVAGRGTYTCPVCQGYPAA